MNRQTATRSTLSLLAFALLPLLAQAAGAPAAGNGIESNGPYLQGVVLNGPILQGVALNGPILQGVVLNGPIIQGIGLNGPAIQGVVLNGPILQGLGLNGRQTRDVAADGTLFAYGQGDGVRPLRTRTAAAGHSPMSGLATMHVVVHLPAR
jgi:hypothetical protein